MLGRLFKQNPYGSSGNQSSNPGCNNSSPGQGFNKSGQSLGIGSGAYENEYTRKNLYGTSDYELIGPYNIRKNFYRVVIAQDSGNLRSKQIVFDSSLQGIESLQSHSSKSSVFSRPMDNNLSSRNITTSKVHHFAKELTDYMFGCALPSNERTSATKLHLLPTINTSVYGPNHSVLITRLFSLDDSGGGPEDKQWNPIPALPRKEYESNLEVSSNYSKSNSWNDSSFMYAKSQKELNCKFGIGLVIPLQSIENDISDVIFSNWEEISRLLFILQNSVQKKLKYLLNHSMQDAKSNTSSSLQNTYCNSFTNTFVINKRVQFPNYILQNDADLVSQLPKLIKMMHFNSNTPKLINSNSFILSSLEQEKSKFRPLLLNWILELLNWLELKDGKCYQNSSGYACSNYSLSNYSNSSHPSFLLGNFQNMTQNDTSHNNTFLASLIALLMPLKDQLARKPWYNDGKDERKITRIVIMTGNPVVAKKLLFIINALIPDENLKKSIKEYEENEPLEYQRDMPTSTYNSRKEKSDANNTKNGSICDSRYNNTDELQSTARNFNGLETLQTLKPEPPFISDSPGARPIPIKVNTTDSLTISGESSREAKSIRSQRWEIPKKSSASVSVEPVLESRTNVVPINVRTKPEMITSMTYLSSSLNSSLSSSASNYSLSKLGTTFLDKWKNSFKSSTAGNLPFQPVSTSSDFADFSVLPASHSFSKRTSVQSMRTPSPALDQDDFPWNHVQNNTPISTSFSNANTISRLSRTQSLLDLYNGNNGTGQANLDELTSDDDKEISVPGIHRSKVSLLLPLMSDVERIDSLKFNKNSIKLTCKDIMEADIRLNKINACSFSVTLEKGVLNEGEYYSSTKDTVEMHADQKRKLFKHQPLSPVVGFVDEFRPEFTLQSCPINPKLELQISQALRNDVSFYNACGISKVTSRCIFISLRAREIKLIQADLNDKNREASLHSEGIGTYEDSQEDFASTSSSYASQLDSVGFSSNTSHHGRPQFNLQNNNIQISSKKLYTNNRTYADKEYTDHIEGILGKMNDLFQKHHNMTEQEETVGKLNEKFSELICSILN